jgi:MATE family multidrug resistance protein
MSRPSSRTSFSWTAEFRASLALGWPLILTNLAQAALTATDVLLLGRLGADALAAGTLAAGMYHVAVIFTMGLVSAAIPMMSGALGRRRHAMREVRRTVTQGFWAALLVCLPIWVGLWHAEAILVALGQSPELAAQAARFMHTLQWALLPHLGYLVLRSFLAAMQQPRWTLLVAAGAIVFNALAGYALIFGHAGFPALGLAGAGIASTASSALMFLGLAIVVTRHRRFRRFHLFGAVLRADRQRLRELVRLGLPIAVTLLLETMIFYAAVVMMGLIGPHALAAHAIAMQLITLCFMVPLGLGQVATVRVARAGADAVAARRAGWAAWMLGVGFMAASALMMLSIPRVLIGAFLDLRDPANLVVVTLAVKLLACAALFQVADGGQAVAAGMLRGLHDTRVPMLLAAVGYWVLGVPFGALLAFVFGLGGVGVWLGMATGLTIVAGLLTRRWVKLSRIGAA